MKIYKVILVFGLLLAFAASAMAAPRATRDLVFDDEDTATIASEANISNAQSISVMTTLDLTRDGQTTSVLPTHQFKSGDKVVLRYTTNTDGYVYWLAKMSSGQYSLLFPTPQTGSDNFIKRNNENVIPTKGAFRFDATVGKEELLMVFAPERIPELEKVVAEVAANKSGNTVSENATQVAKVENNNTNKRATRDLVFDDEDDEQINTQSQVAPQGEPFVAHYILNHE